MKNLVNTIKSANLKGKSFAIALILLLTVSTAIAILPPVKSQAYSYTPTKGTNGLWNIPMFAGLTVSPDPLGLGQTANVIMLLELLPPSVGSEASTLVVGGWKGYTLTITSPDNTTDTLGPFESDVSGTYQVSYTPTSLGTYYFQFSFGGQTCTGVGYGSYYANFLPATSQKVALTVQEQPATGYTEAPIPLPTEYWTRPINDQNRAWSSISGPWLTSTYNNTGTFNPYTYAPDSAHILWTRQDNILTSGLIGGDTGSLAWGGTSGVTGTGYPEQGLNNRGVPIIMDGYMFYNSPDVIVQGLNQNQSDLVNTNIDVMSCINLQTGQTKWTVPGSFNFGQILNWRSQQQRLSLGYLWSVAAGSYKMYDAVNGQLLVQWSNLPVGTQVRGVGVNGTRAAFKPLTSAVSVLSGTAFLEPPTADVVGQTIGGASGGGALLVYLTGRNTGQNNSWLACWNSTLAINYYNGNPTVWSFLSGTAATGSGNSLPSLANQIRNVDPLNWNQGIMWNYTLPTFYTVSATNGSQVVTSPTILGADGDSVVLARGKTPPNATGITDYQLAGIKIARTHIGDFGIPITMDWTTTIPLPAYDQTYPGGATLKNADMLVLADSPTLTIWGYSSNTGQLVWTAKPYKNDFAMQSSGPGTVAYGMDFNPGYDGYMHAINITTGASVWDTLCRVSGTEMPEIGYPVVGAVVADGKVFCSTYKSYETQPAYRGHTLFALDAYTGTQKWNISGEFSAATIEVADGVLIGYNMYDATEYAFRRGLTETTVTAPMTEITAGTKVVIQGSVTDQTPGILQGTPAISDKWMTEWMEYKYMDQPLPKSATGVTVSLDAVDPNGNYVHLGEATSDITGMYTFTWTTPNIAGTYNIIATLGATNSYYSSSGETGAILVDAPASTPAATPLAQSAADMYFVPAVAAIIVAIAIVGIVIVLILLRKRP
jgi:hypothetical protein